MLVTASFFSLLVTITLFNINSSSCFSVKPVQIIGKTRLIGKTRQKNLHNNTLVYHFSVPLINERPKPKGIFSTLNELWNDPRPVSSLLSKDRSYVGITDDKDNDGATKVIPYCIVSDEFQIVGNDDESIAERFQVVLYPRGRFVGSSTSEFTNDSKVTGMAGLYLKYLPMEYGNEVDIAYKMRLVDTRMNATLPVLTSGGLPRSNDTWSAAMTFCTENEAIESIGRTHDWGSSAWSAQSVCDGLGFLKAEVEITLYDKRRGESSFAWPIGSKGGIGGLQASQDGIVDDEFRVGEVIVPVFKTYDDGSINNKKEILEESYVYSGVDYRIMTINDKDGNPIFGTKSLPKGERGKSRLALRPCGWKLQNTLWKKRGMVANDWPVEVEASLLAPIVLSRFNLRSAIPRIVSAFASDSLVLLATIALAIAPIPIALLGRNVVSLYAIPSASMEPTLMRGDVLLVEKTPRVLERSKRGDVILFTPPDDLKQLIKSNGGTPLSSTSLFVKRLVGLPEDEDIIMDKQTDEVKIGGNRAVGPNRNLCEDEPLRLIDKLLENGKGIDLERLGNNEVYVLGDCKAVSVDSRVFGALSTRNVVGKPIARIWPIDRITFKDL